MKSQFFSFTGTTGEKFYFSSCINGEGYYDPQNGSVLGTLYDKYGHRLNTSRVMFSILKPLQFSEITALFPEYKYQ